MRHRKTLVTVAVSAIVGSSVVDPSQRAAAFGATAQQETTSQQLDRVEVVGQKEMGYRPERSGAGSRIDTPITELPASVQSVDRQVIDDQKVVRVRDALENVSGVRPNPSIQSGNSFIVRGFADARRVLRDGLSINNFGYRSEFDTATVERVEVLKGPASVLYGRAEPGGIINIVTRRPEAISSAAAEAQAGSFGLRRASVDLTGPLTEGGEFRYRFITAAQASDTFRDFGKSDRTVIAPSLTWAPNANLTWTVSVEHMRQDYIADFGIPVIGNRPANVPITRSFGDPNDTVDSFRRTDVGSDLAVRLNDTFSLRHRFVLVDARSEDDFINPAPAFGNALQADGRTLNRNIFFQVNDTREIATNLDLLADLRFGNWRHRLLAGVDLIYAPDSQYSSFGNFTTGDPRLAIDVFNPSYGIDRSLFEAARSTRTGPTNYSIFRNVIRGAYLQDQITVAERWHVLLGGRHDHAETGRGRGASFTVADQALNGSTPSLIRKDEAFSPRFGALYQWTPWLGVYGSVTRSFGANNGVNAGGAPQPPQRGRQYEIGAKAEFAERRVLATVALFDLQRRNLLTPDLTTADPNDSIAIGRARNRGVEVDVGGEVARGTRLIGAYAYSNGSVIQDNSGLLDKRLVNLPRHAASVSLRHELAAAPALALGAGVFYVGQRQGDAQNTFQLPGYVRVDASAAYRLKLAGEAFTAQLTLRNVFDRAYYESTDPNSNVSPRNGVYPGAPRTVIVSIQAAL